MTEGIDGFVTPSKEDASRFSCLAEQRAARRGRTLKYEPIGDRLMALRKQAWDRYDTRALQNTPGDATLDAMRGVACDLRRYGDMQAVHLAAAIISEVKKQESHASG